MKGDAPGRSYLEAILVAIRGAGQRMSAVSRYLQSAEKATLPTWKWQLLSAASREHEGAISCLDEAEERLRGLAGKGGLPAPLDQLPGRLDAMRADLQAAEDRLQKALSDATSTSLGTA